jgi:hypothetical protein
MLLYITYIQGPLYPFAKQPLNLKFVNADCDLTKIFDTPYSSFQDILNNHTFSVRKCVRRNASPRRKRRRTGQHGQDPAICSMLIWVNLGSCMVYLCNTPWIIHYSIAILNDCSPNVLSTKGLNKWQRQCSNSCKIMYIFHKYMTGKRLMSRVFC